MKIKKTAAAHTAAAMILTAAFLLAGCKTDIAKYYKGKTQRHREHNQR